MQAEKLKSNKSPAPGGLQPARWEELDNEAAELPAESKLWLEASAARERSLFCSVFNFGRHKDNCGNYSPVSFIPAPSKLAEKIIKAHVEMPVLRRDGLRTTKRDFYTGNSVVFSFPFFFLFFSPFLQHCNKAVGRRTESY